MIINQYGVKMDSSELRAMCIRNEWFTCGTNRQYNKLFYMLEMGAPLAEIATVIWVCSDEEKVCRRDILAEFEREGYKEKEGESV